MGADDIRRHARREHAAKVISRNKGILRLQVFNPPSANDLWESVVAIGRRIPQAHSTTWPANLTNE